MLLIFIPFTRQEHIFKVENVSIHIQLWMFQTSVRIPETLQM